MTHPRSARAAAAVLTACVLASLPFSQAAASVALPAAATVSPLETVGPAPKIVIIVGAVEGKTGTDRAFGDSVYAEAIKWTPNVIKVFSPNATWEAVKAAAQGANILVYIGHGYGYPSPYKPVLTPSVHDGFGLNADLNLDGVTTDYEKKYYGESYIASEIKLAPGALVFLNHACYAGGSSETGDPQPTVDVAMQRVDNFASGFLRAGARTVIASSGTTVVEAAIRGIFTTHQTMLSLWRSLPMSGSNEFAWTPARNPGYRAVMDPDYPFADYYRSIVGDFSATTDGVLVPFAPTNVDPPALVAPGAAVAVTPAPAAPIGNVATGGLTLYTDSTLATPNGTELAPGAAARVDEIVPGGTDQNGTVTPTTVRVHALAGPASGWMDAAGLSPRDSAAPVVWAVDGARFATPNGDGIDDALALTLRLSEPASWTFTIRDGGGATLATFAGTGDRNTVLWDAKVNGATVPAGTYGWTLSAADAWGNPTASGSGTFDIRTTPPLRLYGRDRYSTAAAISAANFAPGVAVAYLASGLDFPDALAGAAAAGAQKSPVLLTDPLALPAPIAAELTRLRPGRIVILGGTGAVSDAVAAAAAAYSTGGVTRLSGPDRYATAAAISAATFAPGVPVAYLAPGRNFPDALAGAAVAGRQGAPVLLSEADSIPAPIADELARLKPGRIVLLGGPGVLTDAVLAAAAAFTTGGVTRLSGPDRYATAAAISAASFPARVPVVYLASGLNFPDALAGAAVAGTQGAPVLLTDPGTLPTAIATELVRLAPGRIVLLGGPGVVTEGIRVTASRLLGWNAGALSLTSLVAV